MARSSMSAVSSTGLTLASGFAALAEALAKALAEADADGVALGTGGAASAADVTPTPVVRTDVESGTGAIGGE